MDETELDFEESLEMFPDELEDSQEVVDEHEDDLWEPEPTQKSSERRTSKKKIVIPPNAHPIEIFMLTKDFQWGHITGISGLAKDVLVDIIRGDAVTEDVRKRLRLTTGIIV